MMDTLSSLRIRYIHKPHLGFFLHQPCCVYVQLQTWCPAAHPRKAYEKDAHVFTGCNLCNMMSTTSRKGLWKRHPCVHARLMKKTHVFTSKDYEKTPMCSQGVTLHPARPVYELGLSLSLQIATGTLSSQHVLYFNLEMSFFLRFHDFEKFNL